MDLDRMGLNRIVGGRFGVALLGAVLLAGCGKSTGTVKGVAPASEATITVAQLAKTPSTKQVVLSGEMTEKCPVAGCWFMLRDKTGIVRVDTKSAGFVVTDVPVHTHLTVAGRVASGGEPMLSATGLRY